MDLKDRTKSCVTFYEKEWGGGGGGGLTLVRVLVRPFLLRVFNPGQGFSQTVPFAGPLDSTSMIMGVLA